MNHHRFPWLTVVLLGLTTYLLIAIVIVVLSLWWQATADGWRATGEPWVNGVVLHAGALFILWQWWGFIGSLWER